MIDQHKVQYVSIINNDRMFIMLGTCPSFIDAVPILTMRVLISEK